MKKIRVLIVDDAAVIRRLLTNLLSEDPDLEIVGTAANGQIALQQIERHKPDIVTLDVEMPEMDGLETLKHIRARHLNLHVIMFSTLTQRAASQTLAALALGASDYVTKPANSGSMAAGVQRVKDDLIPKIKALCGRSSSPAQAPRRVVPRATARPPVSVTRVSDKRTGCGLVALGVSTGGPNALAEIIPALPETLQAPVLIVQHMPPMFTRLLAERLDAQSTLTVQECETGSVLKPGTVYLAPGDQHMVVKRRDKQLVTSLNRGPRVHSCRPAVDVLFQSIAETCGNSALAVVLTGMGNDGVAGCKQIRQSGGHIVIQDEATSVVWGMPGMVAEAGLADQVLPLQAIAAAIIRATGSAPVSLGRPPMAATARVISHGP